MSKHTPEPWSLLEAGDCIKHQVPVSSDRTSILTIATEGAIAFGAVYSADDARRIVACVNACRGLSTDELVQHGLVSAVGTELLELEQQRDELLAALQGMIDIANDSQGVAGYHLNGEVADWGEFEEWQAACDAIAKAKGGSANNFPDATKMVQDGWQLVPAVATKAMWAAWDSAPCNNEDDAVNLEAAYRAMLAAAPKHEGGAS